MPSGAKGKNVYQGSSAVQHAQTVHTASKLGVGQREQPQATIPSTSADHAGPSHTPDKQSDNDRTITIIEEPSNIAPTCDGDVDMGEGLSRLAASGGGLHGNILDDEEEIWMVAIRFHQPHHHHLLYQNIASQH